jgi:hypothetical protein
MEFSAQHCQGLQDFLNQIWWVENYSSMAAGGDMSTTSMGFRPAVTTCAIASCGHNGNSQSFTCNSAAGRDCWWYVGGQAYCFYCLPLSAHEATNELQENLVR